MFKRLLRHPVGMFQAPLPASLGLGTLLCLSYYAMLKVLPESYVALLARYSESHVVAYVTVWMFFVAVTILSFKYLETIRQRKLLHQAAQTLDDIKIARFDEQNPRELEQIHWMDAAWKSQSVELFNSWLGQRIRAVLNQLQIRKSIETLDQDQSRIADRDSNSQHDSFALVRIFAWAMPMLGFLGTVLGLSTTLGKMDASALATGSQKAMDQITQGLYVAFDTTAISLALTMVVIFAQYIVNKQELSLLDRVDSSCNDLLASCLIKIDATQDLSNVEASLQAVTQGVLQSVETLVTRQIEAWAQSLDKAEARWADAAHATRETVEKSLVPAISEALLAVSQPLAEHNERIAKIHSEGASVIDARMQQWQVTISEQSRAMVEQQKELYGQTKLLSELIAKAELVKTVEAPLQATLQRMTDVDRFHDAAICLTEAVAVLGTQMERYGYLGRQPLRRRAEDGSPTSSDESRPVSIPFQRKAG